MATKQIVGHLSPDDHTTLHPLLEGMAAALDLMTALKRKAIDIGKRQHGQMLTPERSAVELRAIVLTKLPALIKYMPKQAGVAVECHVSDDIAHTITTDGSWIFMILLNLVSHAFK